MWNVPILMCRFYVNELTHVRMEYVTYQLVFTFSLPPPLYKSSSKEMGDLDFVWITIYDTSQSVCSSAHTKNPGETARKRTTV